MNILTFLMKHACTNIGGMFGTQQAVSPSIRSAANVPVRMADWTAGANCKFSLMVTVRLKTLWGHDDIKSNVSEL